MPNPTAVIAGAGFIGPVHVEALRRLGVHVKGILGSTPEKTRAATAALGLARAYASYDEVVSDPEVTVVHVATPNKWHHRQVLAALEAGKHVVCEKPLGMTSAETAELVRAEARFGNLVCAVNYNLRFYPMALQARALVRQGRIGEVYHVHGSYLQDWLLYPTDFNWRVLPSEGGELRAVADIGTHWLDLAGFVTGLEIEAVLGDLRTVHAERQRPTAGSVGTFRRPDAARTAPEAVPISTEDYGSVLLRFRNGARGALTVSQVMAGRKNRIQLEIAGSKGSLAWSSEAPDELWMGSRGESDQLIQRNPPLLDPSAARFSDYPAGHNEGFPDTFKQLYRAVYDDVRAGRRSASPLYATFADGHRELLLCEAIARSHRQGSWVPVGAADPAA